MKNQITLLLFAVALMTGCINRSDRSSDNFITEEIDIGNITALSINGIIDLRLEQGDAPAMKIQGEQDAIDGVNIKTSDNRLEITYEAESGLFLNVKTPRITLTLTDLTDLEFDGVGNFVMDDDFTIDAIKIRGSGIGNIQLGMDAKSIDARFDMMGNVKLSGSADSMILRNDGVGQIDAGQLIVQNLDLTSSGIGRIDVHCENELSISVNGIGSVSYSGNPTILKKEVNGIGKVTEK